MRSRDERNGDRRWVAGVACACAAALLFLIGGIGEIAAEGTSDTPKAVLVVSGIVWTAISLSLLALSVATARERRATGTRSA